MTCCKHRNASTFLNYLFFNQIIYENNKSNETRKNNTFKTTTVKLDPGEVIFLTLQLNITNRLNNALCAGHFALPKMVFDYIMAASWLE